MGIVGVLLAAILSVVAVSRHRAAEVRCGSNLHQIGLAMSIYTTQTGYYPGCQHFAGFGDDRTFAVWPTRLRRALHGGLSQASAGAQQVFRCPDNPRADDWRPEFGSGSHYATPADEGFGYDPGERLLQVDHIAFSYAYNDWGAGINGAADADQVGLGGDIVYPVQANGYGSELKASRVRRPAEMIAVSDSTSNGSFNYNIDPREPPQYPGGVHRGGANVLFCDGHVQWYRRSALVNVDPDDPNGAAMNRMWNNDNQIHLGN